jgi:hypothetical protein
MFTITLPSEYNVSSALVIRPVPLISISQNSIRNKKGLLGSFYDITLTGSILPDYSSPYYRLNGTGGIEPLLNLSTSQFTNSQINPPNRESLSVGHAMSSIIHKQNILRELFSIDGAKYELLPASVGMSPEDNIFGLNEEPVLVFYPTLQSISFEEGIYVNISRYTVNLRAEVLLDQNSKIISDGLTNRSFLSDRQTSRTTIDEDIEEFGGFIEDYSESWSIEVDEGQGMTNTDQVNAPDHSPENHIASARGYRLNRNITVTGRSMYKDQNTKYEAWEQAKNYILKTVLKDKDNDSTNNFSGYEQHPEYGISNFIGSGFLNIAQNVFGGYNHLRTFSIDETAGSVTLNDTWVLSSGSAYENYNASLGSNNQSINQSVGINGTIKGLSSQNAGSSYYGGSLQQPGNLNNENSAYRNALNKFYQISNSGQYGPNCYLFKRAQSLTSENLNHIPLSVSLGTNEFTGDITYTIEYDSRPQNLIEGTTSESINCSDNYPGDVFAVIPVLGRSTGPVLQYLGGRTEYQRSLSLDLTFQRYYDSGSVGSFADRIRRLNVLSKPSLNEPYRSQINSIVSAYSPANEFGIRKYFLNPPQETWDATSGKYTLNLTWIYELSN